METFDETFDYVVVGSGSSGGALAARLARDGRFTVLVLERGGGDFGPFIRMPAALSYPMNMARYDWGYRTEPEPGLGGRRLACPRGKVIGGSSSINGMAYVRGNPKDYDAWEAMGARGWGFQGVAGYFRRLEDAEVAEALDADSDSEGASSAGDNSDRSWRGRGGPVRVSRGRMRNPLYEAYLRAAEEAGYDRVEDYNARRQEGFGAMEMTVRDGVRWSSARAYLDAARRLPNFEARKGCLATRILFEGRRAVGVEYVRRGRRRRVEARRETILSAGAINSPQLLMLSGIGDRRALESLGIASVADRKGIGENLQDHLEVYVQTECCEPISLNRRLSLPWKALIGARWMLFGDGLGATNHFEAAGFFRTKAGVEYPDAQHHFLPAAIRYDGKQASAADGYQIHVGPMRSKSRGRIRLRSANPKDAPSIAFNYMSESSDWEDFRRCIRLTREILAQPSLSRYAVREISPGESVRDDDALDAFVRDHAESAYHPCGACRMGAEDDPLAAVDPTCRVIGVDSLRVVDSSIMPRIPNGNLNAPSMMIGEKAADLILERQPPKPPDEKPYTDPEWRTRQRPRTPRTKTI